MSGNHSTCTTQARQLRSEFKVIPPVQPTLAITSSAGKVVGALFFERKGSIYVLAFTGFQIQAAESDLEKRSLQAAPKHGAPAIM